MTHSDTRPVGRREGNPTEARGSQVPSSTSVHNTGYQTTYEGHGGYTGDVHDAPPTQAKYNRDPKSMSVNSIGYGKPTTISAQGNSGHDITDDQFRRYEKGYESDVKEPQYQAQRNPKSQPVNSSGYGNIISHKGHGGYTGVVHDASSTQAKSNQNPSSGYRKPTSIPEQGKSGHGTANEFRRYENGYGNDVQEPPLYQAQRNPKSEPVDTSGYGNIISHEGHGGYTGVVHNVPTTQARSNQNPSSGYRKPTSIPEQRKSGHGTTDEFRRFENEAPSNQAQGSQGPSSKSSDNTGYGNRHEGHGGYTMTGAQGMQNPSSMSVSNTGYEKPHSTPAQGKIGKGPTADGPASTQEWGRQRHPSSMPVDTSGYGKPSSMTAQGNQPHVSPSGYGEPEKPSHATYEIPHHATGAAPLHINVNLKIGQDGTYRVNSNPPPAPPVSQPTPAPAPNPAPAPTKPPKSSRGCCSIL